MTTTHDRPAPVTAIRSLIDRHLGIWSTPGLAARTGMIAETYREDVVLVKPHLTSTGRDRLNDAIEGLQVQVSNMTFAVSSPVQTAQDTVTYAWNLGPPDGTPVATGRDVLVVRDGLIPAGSVFVEE